MKDSADTVERTRRRVGRLNTRRQGEITDDRYSRPNLDKYPWRVDEEECPARTRRQFQQLLESRAAKYIMFDVCWCGGLSEARKIASMAETYELPIAPHTAGGPLLFYASTHLTTAATNVWIQESCQRFYESDWPKMLENPIVPKNGHVEAPDLPGFGMRIKPEIWQHPAAVRQTTTL